MHPFIAHVIGDFILQTDWMASNKKRESFACLIHVLLYLLPFLLCRLCWWQIALIGLEHFVQDRTPFVLWWIKAWKRVPSERHTEVRLFVDQAFHLAWIQVVMLLGGM